MLINATETQCDAFHTHTESGKAQAQQERIYALMESARQDWSIGEIADYTGLDKSTVSARMFELRQKLKKIVWAPKRKDKISGVLVKPMQLPHVQRDLFN